mmetsp:Transcript_20636/g.42423  ORF Transcript_20636/g.42423 Transcript_20636/m.42423 type:complete len:994 (+) Transcript_20636:86-3067(+)
MKSSMMAAMKLCLAILAISVPIARAAHLRAHGRATLSANMTESSSLEASVRSMVKKMLNGGGPGMRDVVSSMHSKMDMLDALKRLDGKLPSDVASLVRLTHGTQKKTHAPLTEASMTKARNILNGMMFDAWGELDDVVIECKEFINRNRDTFGQVTADLARFNFNLEKSGEAQVAATDDIKTKGGNWDTVKAHLDKEKHIYLTRFLENDREMTIRKNDLAVFDWVLNATKCQEGDSFMQLNGPSSRAEDGVQFCNTQDGLELNFKNPTLQAQIEKMMTPSARLALQRALGQLPLGMSLVQVGKRDELAAGTTTPNLTTTLAVPTFAVDVMPVSDEPAAGSQWKKCSDGKPNCGLLHDLMSLEWGKFRDSFDELTAEMRKNKVEFDSLSLNLEGQMTELSDAKVAAMKLLAKEVAQAGTLEEARLEKLEEQHTLTTQYEKKHSECDAQISEILFTRICATRKVRNELMSHSTISGPENMTDCDFTDWQAPKDGVCVSDKGVVLKDRCDDSCDPQSEDPNACGGEETITRTVMVRANAFGMQCPGMSRDMKCGQKKCPVNCLMSEFGGWSSCTKDCGTGVQTRTRSIIVPPKNGGSSCDAIQEERECNTESCTRNCKLSDWSEWSPCSMACGGGVTKRTTKVLIPIRGRGWCPGKRSPMRSDTKVCNTQACMPDQMCIAKQDLVLAIDGSGSVKEDGFETIKKFAANLTERYNSVYFGEPAMQVGVVLFGNGQLIEGPDGSTIIESAIAAQGLTGDLELVRQKIKDLEFQKGFTNMAQALTAADNMLSLGGRSDAQSAVMVISDGKYSMEYQTQEKATELKDKNIQIFMAPITEVKGKELNNLKKWASQPWDTNYERIPGLAALKFNADIFAERLVAKFCPASMSPTLLRQQEAVKEYMMIHKNGWPSWECGQYWWIGKVANKDDCAAAARKKNQLAFSYGRSYADGICYSEAIPVDMDHWQMWSQNRTSVPCENGDWKFNPFFDTFAVEPVATQ